MLSLIKYLLFVLAFSFMYVKFLLLSDHVDNYVAKFLIFINHNFIKYTYVDA